MKQSFKKEIRELMTGKGGTLKAFTRLNYPGIYLVGDKELNENEFQALKKNYDNVIITQNMSKQFPDKY